MVKNLPAMQETLVQCLGREIPQRTEWQPTPVFLPGEFHGQRSLAGYSPWGHKESDTTEQLTHTHTHRDNLKGFPDGSAGEESTCQCRSWGFDPCSMFPLQEGAQVRCLVWELTPHTLCSEVRKTKQKHILEWGNGGMHVLTISTRTYPRSESESEEKTELLVIWSGPKDSPGRTISAEIRAWPTLWPADVLSRLLYNEARPGLSVPICFYSALGLQHDKTSHMVLVLTLNNDHCVVYTITIEIFT